MYCIIHRHICIYLYKIYICYLKYIYLYICDFWAAAYDIIVMETLWCILTLWYGVFFFWWSEENPSLGFTCSYQHVETYLTSVGERRRNYLCGGDAVKSSGKKCYRNTTDSGCPTLDV